MNKPWLGQYPAGIEDRIDVDTHPSLAAALEDSMGVYGRRTAFLHLGRRLTYAAVEKRSRAFAAWLQQEAGLGKGDRFAIMLPNCLEYVIALVAAIRAGLVVVNINPLFTARELEHQLTDSGAKAILVLENFVATLEKVRDLVPVETVLVTRFADQLDLPKKALAGLAATRLNKHKWAPPGSMDFHAAVAHGASCRFTAPELSHDDLLFLQYTGGTMGRAKGAMLSHGNLIANLLQCQAWFSHQLEPEPTEVVLTALPMYHIFALTVNILEFFTLGAKNVLVGNPRDMRMIVRLLRKHRITALTGVNTLFNGLLNTPGFEALDFSSLKFALGGGMATQQSVAESWQRVTGIPIIEGYGLSETSPVVTCNRLELTTFNHSIGLPLPATEVAIRDDQNHDLAVDHPGELCIRGPQVMSGYWNQGSEAEFAFTTDGFFRSGDIARMDANGLFYIVDRKDDMILVSGFNVFPNEIEDVVASHPGVVEGAAIGVADEKSGQAVKLFVVPRDRALDRNAIRTWCADRLTKYKVPKHVEFTDEIPKSPVGKILRRQLR
ncbi:MAG: AMP-binding protein [Salinisphaera sp.]|nr:AMP-binding protein [Salinisphaera sp.]